VSDLLERHGHKVLAPSLEAMNEIVRIAKQRWHEQAVLRDQADFEAAIETVKKKTRIGAESEKAQKKKRQQIWHKRIGRKSHEHNGLRASAPGPGANIARQAVPVAVTYPS
jgi:hypothetical protein